MPLPQRYLECFLGFFKGVFLTVVGFWSRKIWSRQRPEPDYPLEAKFLLHDTASRQAVNSNAIIIDRIRECFAAREGFSSEPIGVRLVCRLPAAQTTIEQKKNKFPPESSKGRTPPPFGSGARDCISENNAIYRPSRGGGAYKGLDRRRIRTELGGIGSTEVVSKFGMCETVQQSQQEKALPRWQWQGSKLSPPQRPAADAGSYSPGGIDPGHARAWLSAA